MVFERVLSASLGIDLGTSNTPVLLRGRGVVSREPSCVAFDTRKGQVLAVGAQARRMEGRTPAHIAVVRPIKDGVISNYQVAEELMKQLLDTPRLRGVLGPRALVGVPCEATPLERRAVQEAVRGAGVRKVDLVSQPVAAAIGAGLPVLSSCGSMIVDVGGGTTEIAVVALGGTVLARSIRLAGDRMDAAVAQWMREEHNLLIGDRTAEEAKLAVGCAMPLSELRTCQVGGRHLVSGLPSSVAIDSDEMCQALQEPLRLLVDHLRMALEDAPTEMVEDIADAGITLCGGGSRLPRIDEYISRRLGVKTVLAPDPESCVAMGQNRMFEDARLMEAVLEHR